MAASGSGRSSNMVFTILFGLLALVATVAMGLGGETIPEGIDLRQFSNWMAGAVFAGVALRALRRKVFFGSTISLHKAASLDALLQGAILLYPQLPYPGTEAQLLARNTGMRTGSLRAWFRVRATAAVSVPLILAAATFLLAGNVAAAAGLAAASLAWILYRATAVPGVEGFSPRFVAMMLLGLSAAAAEGYLFTQASLVAFPDASPWGAFLLYSVVLTAFELSPVPFALGVLELGWLVLSLIPGLAVPGVLMPLAYRLFRGIPILLLTLFYLPRYKMRVGDLFDPQLAAVLAPNPSQSRDARPHEGPLLSVVLPAYNEEKRLPVYLPKVREFCDQLQTGVGGSAEILVVDDGSKDGTAAYTAGLARSDPRIRLISQPFNQGKGAAVRRGVAEARGAYILFADADGATPIGEAAKLLEEGRKGSDVVIGSRKVADSTTRRDRSFLRNLLGSMFYRITNLLAVPGVLDTQCGFKLFRRDAARRIFPLLQESGWAFDVEILFLAQKFGMTIAEVPVNWSAVDGSKVKATDGLRFLSALFRIRHRAAGLTGASGSMARHPDLDGDADSVRQAESAVHPE